MNHCSMFKRVLACCLYRDNGEDSADESNAPSTSLLINISIIIAVVALVLLIAIIWTVIARRNNKSDHEDEGVNAALLNDVETGTYYKL